MPYALQNASHPANIFRIATAAPFTTNGILGATELSVAQQASPNMSVLLGAGRATIQNTSVSNPAGQTWNTGGAYVAYNDAALSLTVTTSNPSNPRIDICVLTIQDSFYSGATNTAVASIIAGTPSVSPVPPSAPSNSIILANIAVGAGVTSIVTSNITYEASLPSIVGVSSAISALQSSTSTGGFSRVGTQTLANGGTAPTLTTMNTGEFATAKGFTVSAGVFTCTLAGLYLVAFSIDGTTANATQYGTLTIVHNAVSYNVQLAAGNNSSASLGGSMTKLLSVAVNDTVQFQARQVSGGTNLMTYYVDAARVGDQIA